MQNRPVVAAAMAACALAFVPARAANPLTSATLMVTPTLETAGLRDAAVGDDNANATGKVQFYHNTMLTARPDVDGITPWTALNNVTWRNNILVATRYAIQDYTTTPAAHADFDHDLLFTSAPGRFVKWGNTRYYDLSGFASGTGQERNGVNADPQFVDVDHEDFRLAPDSPARHRATLIPGINDFLGFAPDLGAYQMGQ